MLTPAFSITQEANFLIIDIKAPYAKVSEAEIFIDECDFKFHSKPYFLRLNLPKPIVEDGQEKAQYNADSGHFTIRVAKKTPGEHFDGLDLLTKLLAPTGQTSAASPLIQVVDGPTDGEGNEEEEEFDWQIDQKPFEEPDLSSQGPKYGFANQRSGVLKRLQDELSEIIELKNADEVSVSRRRELRLAAEETDFKEEHYLADLFDNPAIDDLIKFRPPWDAEYQRLKEGDSVDNIVTFTEDEQEAMRNLPRKEYLLDSSERQQAFLGLVDIIFAYAYNHRSTEGENSVESGWTLCKLSSTLSWLEIFTNLHDVLVTSYRRCLCYPLYRHWKLTRAVFRDVQRIFVLGRKKLLKCLLEIRKMLQDTDQRYILNDLYITDYCVWIQHASRKQIASLAQNLQATKISKLDVGFDLELLENAGKLALEESSDVAKAAEEMHNMRIQKKQANEDAKLAKSLQNKCRVSNGEGAAGFKTGDLESDTESESSDGSGDSYSINEDSDVDNSKLFEYQNGDEDELDLSITDLPSP